jgi:hypothetical protein
MADAVRVEEEAVVVVHHVVVAAAVPINFNISVVSNC